MTRLASSGLLIACAVLISCGDGEPAPQVIVTIPVDAAAPPACDALANQGCAAGEKCTFVYLDPDAVYGRTECTPDGTLDVGETCTESAIGQPDDCRAGLFCLRGTCTEICSLDPDNCASSTICTLISSLFQDQLDIVGVCAPTCNPVAQDCVDPEEGCYLRDLLGTASCARVPGESMSRVQDDICYGPDETRCYINGCARGFDTFGLSLRTCMQFCTPARTGLDAINGDQLDTLRGDLGGVQCGDYDASAGDATNTECRYFNGIIDPDPGMVPTSTLGICLSQTMRETYGLRSCTTHDLNTPFSQENVDNDTYVLGCEPYQDQISGARTMPESVTELKRAFAEALLSSTAL